MWLRNGAHGSGVTPKPELRATSNDQDDDLLRFNPRDQPRGRGRRRRPCRRRRRSARLCLEARRQAQGLRREPPASGGPLDKGLVVDGGQIRCPWHHACFDLKTGEAAAAPAFDALKPYPVAVEGIASRWGRPTSTPSDIPGVATPRSGPGDRGRGRGRVRGGGVRCAKLGRAGAISMVSDAAGEPYDRTLLTKDFLEGRSERTAFRSRSIRWPTSASTFMAAPAFAISTPPASRYALPMATGSPTRNCFSPRARLQGDRSFPGLICRM